MVSELQRENEALKEEHTALQQHVGSLEGEMAAMRADLQALRKASSPHIVLYQHDADNAMNPHGLSMAYQEHQREQQNRK